jgi:hypothetical protein
MRPINARYAEHPPAAARRRRGRRRARRGERRRRGAGPAARRAARTGGGGQRVAAQRGAHGKPQRRRRRPPRENVRCAQILGVAQFIIGFFVGSHGFAGAAVAYLLGACGVAVALVAATTMLSLRLLKRKVSSARTALSLVRGRATASAARWRHARAAPPRAMGRSEPTRTLVLRRSTSAACCLCRCSCSPWACWP